MHFNTKSKGDSVARCNATMVFDGRNTKRARSIFVPARIDAKHRATLNGKTYVPNGDRERARRLANQARKLVAEA
jgi:hypothetical protein